ncbi:MAG: TetR/AcrR family transcriptional regulator [Bacteroidales bacterium]
MNEELINILKRVAQLFMKYGIKSVTMDDISHELGISKKTLYNYVKDKNELVSLIIDMEFEVRDKCFSLINNTYKNAIDELYQVHKIVKNIIKEHSPASVYDLKKYYPTEYQKMHTMRRQKLIEHHMMNLKRGKEEGLYRPEINEELITKLQVQRIENSFENDFMTIEETVGPRVFLEFFEYHIRGIATPKGIEELERQLGIIKSEIKPEF